MKGRPMITLTQWVVLGFAVSILVFLALNGVAWLLEKVDDFEARDKGY